MGRARTLLFASLLGIAATGCATKPRVRLHHAEINSASLVGVGMLVVLKVKNPNSYDVQIRNVRANVVVAGRYALAPIYYSPNQWLASDATTLVPVPVTIPWNVVPGLLNDTLSSPVVPYRVTGSADVTAIRLLGVERDDYPLDEGGTFPRAGLADIARRTRGL